MKAFEAEGIPKESYLRAYDLDEILPWDVLDVSIKKRWLQIELIKAKKEMRTEDCKWGHCYACGVPGQRRGHDAREGDAGRRAAGLRRGDGARERSRRLPRRRQGRRVPPEGDAGAAVRGEARRRRATASSATASRSPRTGDARFLSHRNTMDVLERAIRAAGLPARYSEGFNPHMKLSMGPALALGLESRHEVFDAEGIAPFPAGRRAAHRREAAGRDLHPRSPRARAGRADLAKAVKGARYTVRLDSRGPRRPAPATPSPTAGARPCRRCARSRSRPTPPGASLRFEVNLDQAAGETATAKKVLEDAPRDRARGPDVDVASCAKRPSSADPLYRVTVTARFEAAHNLIDYDGRPRAAPRPLLPRRGRARSREAPAVRRGGRLRAGPRARSRRSPRNSTTATSTSTRPSSAATRRPRTWPATSPNGSRPPARSAGPGSPR